jgi:hypothetical protein
MTLAWHGCRRFMPPGLLRWLAEDFDCFHIAHYVQHNMLLIITIVGLNERTWLLKRNITGVFVQPDTNTRL